MSGPARPLLRLVPEARRPIALTAALSVGAAVLVVVQAGLLAGVVADAFLGGAGLATLGPALVALASVVAVRAALAWPAEAATARTGALVVAQVRGRLLDKVLLLGPRDARLPPAGQLTALAGRGVD